MCLVPAKTRRFLWWIFPKVQRAKKDITVYKVLSLKYRAPYQEDFQYTAGLNYVEGKDTESKRISNNPKCRITTGWLHAYLDRNLAFDLACFLNNNYGYYFGIWKMTIPKGTKYILGINNQICAKILRLNKLDVYFK